MSPDPENPTTSDSTGIPGGHVADADIQPAPGRDRAAGRLDGKVALITGAATGLGRVGAERFAAEGAAVVVADVADPTSTVAAIEAAGGKAIGVFCDVTDAKAV
ncbi:MAG: SDR family NAD(P)-dependent oxidoreductase, partial [Candidatus Microthrix parvicella]